MDVRIRQRMLNLSDPPRPTAFAVHLLEELNQALRNAATYEYHYVRHGTFPPEREPGTEQTFARGG